MSTENRRPHLASCSRLLGAAIACVLVGCLETQHEPPARDNTCTACHGDTTRPIAKDRANPTEAAPPLDLNGNTTTSARGVGAHQAHLNDSATHVAMRCEYCHEVPDKVFAAGHLDNPDGAKITFSGRATSNEHVPSYDPKTQACTNTYCHGDGQFNWVAPRDSDKACGSSCHTLPPPAPHPQNDQCFTCHGPVIDKDRHFVNKALHVDGTVETGNLQCNSCHGTRSDGGPPPDLEGNTVSSAPGVGAHTNHLVASATHAAVACNQCHVVPTSIDSPGHIDAERPADITFGTLATNDGKDSPAYDFASHSCSGTYCHASYTPVWTQPRDSQTACGSCHGLPPAAPHPQKTDCSTCHAAVIDANRNFLDPGLHVNGVVDVNPPCSGCHGDATRASDSVNGALTRAAPPTDLSGDSDVTLPGVGAHQRHLQASATHGAVACSQCHVVPSAWNSSGHDVTGAPPAVITFGTLASQDHPDAAYSYSNNSCTNTYCHANATPIWTAQRDSSQTCGTCHSLPPPFVANVPISAQSHPKVTDCSRCHGAVIDANRNFTAPERHVDGNVDVQLTCSSCHGSSASPAPPNDLSGNTAITALGVGAHQAHLTGGNFSRPVPCGDCHQVPSNVNDPGHIDDWTTAEVKFSEAAVVGGHVPSWDRQTATCTDSWCHGPISPGNVSPIWNDPNPRLSCNSCHGTPPSDHTPVSVNPNISQCYACHTNVRSDFTFVDRNLHINGRVDF